MKFKCYAITSNDESFIPMNSLEDAKDSLTLLNDGSDPEFTGTFRIVKLFEKGQDELEFEEMSGAEKF